MTINQAPTTSAWRTQCSRFSVCSASPIQLVHSRNAACRRHELRRRIINMYKLNGDTSTSLSMVQAMYDIEGLVESAAICFGHVGLLSSLISSVSLDHHLYAYDTQLFFSFHPLNFESSISHLQNALQQISSWMTANLLNSSKTKFLLIGLKTNLPKCTTLHLRHRILLEILAPSLTNILIASLTKLHLSSSTSFWYQLLHFRLIYSFIHHFFLFWGFCFSLFFRICAVR